MIPVVFILSFIASEELRLAIKTENSEAIEKIINADPTMLTTIGILGLGGILFGILILFALGHLFWELTTKKQPPQNYIQTT